MAQLGPTTCCDTCGEVLRGKKGITWVDESHIAFRGSMVYNYVDDEDYQDHSYITEDPQKWHHYCGFNCLKDFAKYRIERYKEIQEAKRRERLKRETDV